MKLVVEPDGGFVVVGGVRILQLGLDLLQLPQLFVGDIRRRTRGELTSDIRLHIRDVGEVSLRHRQYHKPAPRLLRQQPFGLQLEECLTHGGDADAQFRRQLVQPHVLPRRVGAVEDASPNETCDVLGQLRPGGEIRGGHIRSGSPRAIAC